MPWGPISEEGSCEEEELDLVKAFLRDSDSDCEDAYYIRPSSARHACLGGEDKPRMLQDELCPLALGGKGGKLEVGFGLGSSTCRANSSSLLHLSSRLDACTAPESGSPHSQGNSSLTTFQSTASDVGSQEREDSTFHSVLSLASTSTTFDIESVEDCPDRKRKASWPVLGHPEKKPTPAESVSSAVAEKSPTPPPALAPLATAKQCRGNAGVGQGIPPLSTAPGVFPGGSISTGVPVDTLAAPTPPPLPFARSPAPVAAYSAAWPAYQAPLPGKGTGVVQTLPWRPPQAMIPTGLPAATHHLAPARTTPATATTSAVSTQKIAAALAEMSKLPVGAGPLGLVLDKVGVTNALKGMGVKRLAGL